MPNAEKLRQSLSQFDVSLLADALDALGCSHQVLPRFISKVAGKSGGTYVGFAKTFQYSVLPESEWFKGIALEKQVAAIQRYEAYVGKGDFVAIGFTSSPPSYGIVGGLFSSLYSKLGAEGIITDGCVRDSTDIRGLELAVFASGLSPVNARGRVRMEGLGRDTQVGGILIKENDLIVGNEDGAIVIPKEFANDELIKWLEEKHQLEKATLKCVQGGQMLSEVFGKFGQL